MRAREDATAPTWTLIGNLGSAHRAAVDPWGSVMPWPDGWSVAWWIGAEDRWHFPPQEPAVRQSLVDASPVVETLMRVPGGDVGARAYAVVADADVVVVEVENRSPVPVALALVVEPGHGSIRRLELAREELLVDGRVALVLPRPPSAAIGATAAAGDLAAWVASGSTTVELTSVVCKAGRAAAAVVFPVAHGATLRAAIPLSRHGHARLSQLPPSAAVARAWEVQARQGARFALPAGRLADVFEANRRFLLAAAGALGPPGPDAAVVLGALGRLGFHREVADVLRTLPDHQHVRGSFDRDPARTGAAVAALANHWRLARDDELLDHLLPTVALGARSMARARRRISGWDDLWVLRGLLDAAELLRVDGSDRAATRAAARAAALRADLDRAALSTDPGGLVAFQPLRLLPPDDSRLVAAPAPNVVDAARLAAVELATRDPHALVRLHELVASASATGTWRVGPDGHSLVAAASFVDLVRDLLVTEVEDGVAVLRALPEDWRGQEIEVHDAPTGWGSMSFAVRWHGERPALLWSMSPHPGFDDVRLYAPGLDPDWSSAELRGEALLRG